MSFRIKEIITDKFWIVESNQGKIGTIRRLDKNYQFFNQINMTSNVIESLEDFEETVDKPASDTSAKNCKGYPTNSTTVISVTDPKLPLFKKSQSANTLFAAGYYVIKFKDWLPSFCPKHKTLEDREYLGPFFTEWEMNIEMKRVKKAESWQ